MTYRTLKMFSILLPTFLIGGFEYIRHDYLLDVMTMEEGNLYITILTLILSFLFATWMFRMLERMNARLAEEQAKRAVYEERERLAQELHDGIAQTLFFLNVKLKKGRLDEASAAVATIDQQVRQAIFNLRALPEEGSSLRLRLEKWLGDFTTLTGIDVTPRLGLPDDRFTATEQVQLFGIIQEAFANIRKHSGAKQVDLTLQETATGGWQLAITDDGRGIAAPLEARQGYGLTMMQERAQKLGADFDITGTPSGGTQLLFTSCKGRLGR
ncbi:two-component system nitrate/nitrite sensor histidine kinase NarX [Tumebacillus sp. BK434]|uniref:sensor histidine kinase n=1 Tax=Tumebacillus sp. BK434 TaxID=2512169 RepID=UPI00104AE327|nr:sensor histidine kinase [Tumebacillus sp. BK434]TCP54710.1 two-component system nitrate/nitrite sensor histidine kinase NarX [Tumebacillus sp. BK434]